MGTNFNIVKKSKSEEEENDFLDEDDIEVEEKTSSVLDKTAKKRMFLFMGIISGVVLLLFFVLFLVSMFSHRTYSYENIETLLQSAAESYFKDYPESLPVNDGDIVEIDSSNLVAAGKMKDLSEYTAEGVLCSATVQVEKSGTEYLYTPYLNCGDSYTTVELAKKIVQDESNIVTSGYGLYSMNGAYVYRGEEVNNYIKLGDSLWRIVKITSDNNLVLIHDTGVMYNPQPWDDRYNEKTSYNSGFNQYSNSRIREYLNKIYESPSDDEEKLLSKKNKAKLVSYNLCVGKRSASSEGLNNTEECSDVLRDQKYGLLTLSEYMSASLDAGCKNAGSLSCTNYNYLAKVKNWWLATGNKDDDVTVFKVNSSAMVKAEAAATYATVRPVVYLNSKVLYKSGNGTFEKPYKVK